MKDLELVKNLVSDVDYSRLQHIAAELADTFQKKQIFRTDTEARISVLNDGKHPTLASKYWQAVREQNVMLENLISLSFDYRRNELEIRRNLKKFNEAEDEFDREEIQINLDECAFKRANMDLVARDRTRELLMWSDIKSELDNGSFDTQDVNTHQAESLKLALENRANSLSPGSSQAEILNVLGPLSTVNRLTQTPEEHQLKLAKFNEPQRLT
jgi:hypothetical protein